LLAIAMALLFANVSAAQAREGASSFATLSARANSARDESRLDEAATLYKKALALRPSWAEGWWSLGTIQYDRNAYADAAHAFRKLVLLQSRDGNAHVMLGLSEVELGQEFDALTQLQLGKSLGIAKDQQLRHVVLYHEGVLLQRMGKFEAAEEPLAQLCLEGFQDDSVKLALGMVVLRMKDRSPPADQAVSATILSVGGAQCLAAQKKLDEAREDYAAVLQAHPDFPKAHYAYGRFLLEVQDVDAATAEFRKEIENNPKDVYSRLQIAAANYKVNSPAGIPSAQEALKLDPQLPLGHYLLGLLLLDTDDFQKATPELEIAQKAFPRDPKVALALGNAYARLGRSADAARARTLAKRLSEAEALHKQDNGRGHAESGAAMQERLDSIPQ
jgi:tetratricopeptide (TPR) repeat protein